ncbi:MAG: lipoprotein-releasing system ATP-binding protein LolD [Candidatus Altiarchaeales archaeon HGW-Altiarchaeales-3]|nr:MAG: lipoprotein-releasing system ATP-binding protein LolD [Candidatus Altiarchaeales archaeon HGW-Altiarchaeales-3]
MLAIKLENVKRFYNVGKPNEFRALKNINFEVGKGEFIGIIGPSGSGKSTLLNMVGCLDTPTDGKVYIKNRDVSELSTADRAKIRREEIGFVFQQFNLIRALTCAENIELPMEFAGVSVSEMKKRANELLEMVGLTGKGTQIPSEMSGGEQQRVAIARALANNPEIILADEPTGNLDTKTGEKIVELLIGLNRNENKTLVVITHDKKIAGMADRIIQIQDGEIV